MAILHSNMHAAFASITMEVVFSATNSADSAALAVKVLLFLPVIVKKVANIAKVASKLNTTLLALLLWLLDSLALHAPDLLDGFSVKLVVFLWIHLIVVLDLIVAQPADEEFEALGAPLLTSALVVLAA